jgi:hypothetical protein
MPRRQSRTRRHSYGRALRGESSAAVRLTSRAACGHGSLSRRALVVTARGGGRTSMSTVSRSQVVTVTPFLHRIHRLLGVSPRAYGPWPWLALLAVCLALACGMLMIHGSRLQAQVLVPAVAGGTPAFDVASIKRNTDLDAPPRPAGRAQAHRRRGQGDPPRHHPYPVTLTLVTTGRRGRQVTMLTKAHVRLPAVSDNLVSFRHVSTPPGGSSTCHPSVVVVVRDLAHPIA